VKNRRIPAAQKRHFFTEISPKNGHFCAAGIHHFPIPLTVGQVNPLAIEFFGQIPI
jgi:hypothetical protein